MSTFRKPLHFGLYGAAGCLLLALVVGEPLLLLAMPPASKGEQTPQVDVLFVLDVTGSMQKCARRRWRRGIPAGGGGGG